MVAKATAKQNSGKVNSNNERVYVQVDPVEKFDVAVKFLNIVTAILAIIVLIVAFIAWISSIKADLTIIMSTLGKVEANIEKVETSIGDVKTSIDGTSDDLTEFRIKHEEDIRDVHTITQKANDRTSHFQSELIEHISDHTK